MSIKVISLVVGMATYIPGLRILTGRRTGGTVSARYCYSVWLRHLSMLYQSALPTTFKTTAELGPGDSLGIGLAALLSGKSGLSHAARVGVLVCGSNAAVRFE